MASITVVDDGRNFVPKLGFALDFLDQLSCFVFHPNYQDIAQEIWVLHQAVVPKPPEGKDSEVCGHENKKYGLRFDIKKFVSEKIKIGGCQSIIDERVAQKFIVKSHIVFARGNIIQPVDVKNYEPETKKYGEGPKKQIPNTASRDLLVANQKSEIKRAVKDEDVARQKQDFFELVEQHAGGQYSKNQGDGQRFAGLERKLCI